MPANRLEVKAGSDDGRAALARRDGALDPLASIAAFEPTN